MLIARSTIKLVRMTLKKDRLLWVIFLVNALVTAWTEAKNRSIKAFVDGVTAAATGAIGGAAFVLARRSIVDVWALLIGLVTMAILLKVKKAPEPLVIVAAGVVGLSLKTVMGG